MSNFQSISARAYRNPEKRAIGFPTDGRLTVAVMRERARTAFGERLKKAREAKKLTQPQLAKLAGVAQGTVGEAETTAIGSKHTAAFAAVLGVRAEWLSTGTGPMVDRSTPRLSDEVVSAIAALNTEELARLESVIRAHLGITRINVHSVADAPAQPLEYQRVTGQDGGPVGNPSPYLDTLPVGGKRSAGSPSRQVPLSRSRRGPKGAA